MQIYVRPGDELPIYRQIVRQVEDAIAGDRLAAGDRLPSHRELAEQLVIAPLTVKKAYDELERDGLIETQRGRGTFVGARLPARDPAASRERLRDAAERLLSQAALCGVLPGGLCFQVGGRFGRLQGSQQVARRHPLALLYV